MKMSAHGGKQWLRRIEVIWLSAQHETEACLSGCHLRARHRRIDQGDMGWDARAKGADVPRGQGGTYNDALKPWCGREVLCAKQDFVCLGYISYYGQQGADLRLECGQIIGAGRMAVRRNIITACVKAGCDKGAKHWRPHATASSDADHFTIFSSLTNMLAQARSISSGLIW
jgi:hypothetical protein